MTEDEAKIKWCPQVRYVVNHPDLGLVGNRFDNCFEDECKCKASGCAMWVWDFVKEERKHPELKEDDCYKKSGHCGLINNGAL